VNDDERFSSDEDASEASHGADPSGSEAPRRGSAGTSEKGAAAAKAASPAPRARARVPESPRSSHPLFPSGSAFRGERGAAADGSRRVRGRKKAAVPKRRLPRELSWL